MLACLSVVRRRESVSRTYNKAVVSQRCCKLLLVVLIAGTGPFQSVQVFILKEGILASAKNGVQRGEDVQSMLKLKPECLSIPSLPHDLNNFSNSYTNTCTQASTHHLGGMGQLVHTEPPLESTHPQFTGCRAMNSCSVI